jgi:multisubunit Na+/H+ antiporter MnhE subunit
VVVVALLAASTWYILLGQDPASWIIGVPCVALCAWLSRSVLPARRMRLSIVGALQLLQYFLRCSLVGGWDVASRVLGSRVRINPGYVDFRLSIPPGPGRTFFVQFIGLLPGTLGAWQAGDTLKVHVLEIDMDHQQGLRTAEQRVAALFAEDVGD